MSIMNLKIVAKVTMIVVGLFLLWAVGSGGLEAADWTAWTSGTPQHLKAMAGAGADQAFAVGDGGTILRFDGDAWTAMSGAETHLRAVWTRPDGSQAFAVGDNGRCYRYDGNTEGLWTEMATPTDQRFTGITDVGGDLLFAVGVLGDIIKLDINNIDGGWALADVPDLENPSFYAVWGCGDCSAAYAVGLSGTILRYDGAQWLEMVGPTTNNLLAVWGADENNVFAVGFNGTIIHYDGGGWSEMNSGVTSQMAGVWGRTAEDVWAVGENGTILYYDGNGWSQQESGSNEYLRGAYGTPDGVFAVGNNGTILYQGANGPPSAAITGTITANIGGQIIPVAGATVSVPGTDIKSVQTDEKGQYTLSNLREGTYNIQLEAPGMAPTSHSVQAVEGETQTADLAASPPAWINTAVNDQVADLNAQVESLNAQITQLKTEMDALYTQAELDDKVAKALAPFDVGVAGKVGLAEAIHALRIVAGIE